MKETRFKWNKNDRSWWQRMPIVGKFCLMTAVVCSCITLIVLYLVSMSNPATAIITMTAVNILGWVAMAIVVTISVTWVAFRVDNTADTIAHATKTDYAQGYADGKEKLADSDGDLIDANAMAAADNNSYVAKNFDAYANNLVEEWRNESKGQGEARDLDADEAMRRHHDRLIKQHKQAQQAKKSAVAEVAKQTNPAIAQPTEPVEAKPQQYPQPQQPNGQKPAVAPSTNQQPVTPAQASAVKPEQSEYPDNVVAVISPGEHTDEIDVMRIQREINKNDPSDGLPGLGRGKWDRTGEPPSIEEQMAEIGLGKNAKVVLTSLLSKGGLLMKSRCRYWGDLPPAIMDELRSFFDVHRKADTHSDAVGQ